MTLRFFSRPYKPGLPQNDNRPQAAHLKSRLVGERKRLRILIRNTIIDGFSLSQILPQKQRPDKDAEDYFPPYQMSIPDGEQPTDKPDCPAQSRT